MIQDDSSALPDSGDQIDAKNESVDREIFEINWIRLVSRLKEHCIDLAKAELMTVNAGRPVHARLKSAFDAAGWKTSGAGIYYDVAPNVGAYRYDEGIKVSGVNRVLVEAVARELSDIGLPGVFTEIETTKIKPDHLKWPHVQAIVKILIGHST